MKKLLLIIFIFRLFSANSQSISPSIKSIKGEFGVIENDTKWLLPFRKDNDLAQFYDSDQASKLAGLSVASIRPGFNNSKTNSAYVELISLVPSNIFRISLGTNIVQSSLKDSLKTSQEIALQKLTNGGGNIVLNISRPLAFKKLWNSSFILLNADITFFTDIDKFNQDVYNPGWGMLINPNLDLRIYNSKIGDKDNGDIFRFGINTRWQKNIINNKYSLKNEIDSEFRNLSIFSSGVYIGIAMFNIQINYNLYNKNIEFFKEKSWLLRVELIPVKF
ncbi:hypothetical protein [Siphonobacter sp. SORGH_AS_0500]|uniref:hypothetical protein n=1 Tax=Siphonobacter sp. SORGH_AS_0500 TaxID=1864824 RepID=UPI00285E52D0|nr:hypothetical protein [Siphonobacter sp. SORGH_AS_0500]MDR6193305.1 hypothetical protein [Siphonobacter sp. SORGH_AS_0500]